MRSSKIKMFRFLLLPFLTLTFFNCSSNKEVSSNKDFVLEANKKRENPQNKDALYLLDRKEFVLNAQEKAKSEEVSNILYLVDGRKVDANYIKTLESYKIKSLTVVKNKKEVAKYSNKKYDGVILITMKK